MFRGFALGILTVIMVGAIFAYIVVRTGAIPANADSRPLWLESWAAGSSLDAVLARDAPRSPNPIPLTPENLIVGIKLYGEHCAFCMARREEFPPLRRSRKDSILILRN